MLWDNDLKFHYIQMQGETTPETSSRLDNIFESKSDGAKIIRKQVVSYEKNLMEEIKLLNKARLKEQEAEQLKRGRALCIVLKSVSVSFHCSKFCLLLVQAYIRARRKNIASFTSSSSFFSVALAFFAEKPFPYSPRRIRLVSCRR